MIKFTSDLSMSNRKAGEWLLGYYWRASRISKAPYYPITNFKGMLDFLDKNYPTYIEYLGSLSKSITTDKLIEAMKTTASRGLIDYPRPAYFANTIAAGSAVSTGEVISETASEVGSGILNGLQLFSYLVIVGVIVVGFIYIKPYLKAFKK